MSVRLKHTLVSCNNVVFVFGLLRFLPSGYCGLAFGLLRFWPTVFVLGLLRFLPSGCCGMSMGCCGFFLGLLQFLPSGCCGIFLSGCCGFAFRLLRYFSLGLLRFCLRAAVIFFSRTVVVLLSGCCGCFGTTMDLLWAVAVCLVFSAIRLRTVALGPWIYWILGPPRTLLWAMCYELGLCTHVVWVLGILTTYLAFGRFVLRTFALTPRWIDIDKLYILQHRYIPILTGINSS